ncbi:MAG: ribosome-associated translation inhibitor RaiA [Proteobacteria bacterium]|nr:ribosome-associated translation inhibitor RaiA [Pseudomonadota bacterium]
MNVNVSGRNVAVGQALETHISNRLKATSDKYFNQSIEAAATVSRQGPEFRVECALHPVQGVNLHSHAEGADVYTSFEDAAKKLEKQLRRFKRRIKNHHDSKRETKTL